MQPGLPVSQVSTQTSISTAAATARTTFMRSAQFPAVCASAHRTSVHSQQHMLVLVTLAPARRSNMRACTAGDGVRQLVGWKRDLPQQEERARLLREVSSYSCSSYCSRDQGELGSIQQLPHVCTPCRLRLRMPIWAEVTCKQCDCGRHGLSSGRDAAHAMSNDRIATVGVMFAGGLHTAAALQRPGS
jgi:hypothetical protein